MNPKMHHAHTMTGGAGATTERPAEASISLMDITPDCARELLARNTSNRQLSRQQCAKFKRDILAGNWAPNTSLIVIGAGGNLCNGQHTLTAIAEAGVTTRCAVLVDPSLANAHGWRGDRGRTRSAEFVHDTNKEVWAVCRTVAEHVTAHRPSDGEVAAFIEPVSAILGRLSATVSRGRSSAPVRTAVATLVRLNPGAEADIAANYSAFVNNRFSGLTVATHSLAVALAEGRLRTGGETDRNELLVRSFMAFDPARGGRNVVIKDFAARLADVRAAMRAAWLMNL